MLFGGHHMSVRGQMHSWQTLVLVRGKKRRLQVCFRIYMTLVYNDSMARYESISTSGYTKGFILLLFYSIMESFHMERIAN